MVRWPAIIDFLAFALFFLRFKRDGAAGYRGSFSMVVLASSFHPALCRVVPL